MFILDSLLVGGLRFVLDKLATAAAAESEDDGLLRDRLLEAQMRLELGEISEGEFTEIERDVLSRLRAIRASRPDALTVSPHHTIAGVDVESYDEEDRT